MKIQVFWSAVPGQQGVYCLAQAGQEGKYMFNRRRSQFKNHDTKTVK